MRSIMKKFWIIILLFSIALGADVRVKTVDLLKSLNVSINGAGPVLVQVDTLRQRVVLANTLTSSLSIIDVLTDKVENVPLQTRALQHLKSEAMTLNQKTGQVYLIGDHSLHIIEPESKTATFIPTDKQYESVAVDETNGHVFLSGRESKHLAFYQPKRSRLSMLNWLEHEEPLVNLNQSPPPPIRKVIVDQRRGQLIAVDGFSAEITLFRTNDGKQLNSFNLPLSRGGRWHLAGYDQIRACLYLVIETNQRRVTTAARIHIPTQQVDVVMLPELTEGVGITYHPGREEVYIPYDNHPTLHVVAFAEGGKLHEIQVPTYGNDATALDMRENILYLASWAQGEIDVIDLQKRELKKRILHKGILPHMFNMAYNPANGRLYIPKGATAVNGSFGAALSVLNPITEEMAKIYTGWAPIDIVNNPHGEGIIVFNNEDAFATIEPDGAFVMHLLPVEYPITARTRADGDIYLSYGAHQSYWPVVYIWDAKNGILRLNPKTMSFYDRRIPRQAHQMVEDKNGRLYFLQNSWGKEEQFLGLLTDGIRDFEIGQRIRLGVEIERETVPRLLHYDADLHRLYAVRVGETETDPGLLHIVALDSHKVIARIATGINPTDLIVDKQNIYISNFSSNTITIVDKYTLSVRTVPVSEQPLRLAVVGSDIYALSHKGRCLHNLSTSAEYRVPTKGLPEALIPWRNQLLIAVQDRQALYLYLYDPQRQKLHLLHINEYPYGDTRFDSGNVSFYLRGQYGDAVFHLIRGLEDDKSRLWLSDFLAGKVYIIEEQ